MAVIGPAAMMSNNDAAAVANNEAIMTQMEEDAAEKYASHQKQGVGKESVEVVDKAVGAWHGARRRGFGEEGGGAPCPGEFLLREDER